MWWVRCDLLMFMISIVLLFMVMVSGWVLFIFLVLLVSVRVLCSELWLSEWVMVVKVLYVFCRMF